MDTLWLCMTMKFSDLSKGQQELLQTVRDDEEIRRLRAGMGSPRIYSEELTEREQEVIQRLKN